MSDAPVYTIDEFEQESKFIDKLIWEAIVIEKGSKVLVCGYGPDGAYVQRAIDAGADVTVIEHRSEFINRFGKLDAKLLRGSTSVIPAKDNSFELAISYHYLHEIDPFFHSQVLGELARVARRVAVIEPAPPADPLGKRIALLYSQAKRELGQFEYYQPLEYWKKILQGVKADVSQHVFAFAKVPPREYLKDTVALMLDTIEVEEAPKQYMEELRAIASRSDASMLPPPRFVLVGAAAGELIVPHFTQRTTRPVTARPALAAAPQTPAPAAPPSAAEIVAAIREVSQDTGYEFPPVEAPPAATQQPAQQQQPAPQPQPTPQPQAQPPPAPMTPPGQLTHAPPPPAPPPVTFGFAPQPPAGTPSAAPGLSPFGMPFAVPPGAAENTFGLPPEGVPPNSTWAWEPPENPENPAP